MSKNVASGVSAAAATTNDATAAATAAATTKEDVTPADKTTIDSIPDTISADAVPKVVYSSSKKRAASNYRLVPRLSIAYVRHMFS